MSDFDEFLAHFGVKGMKWGVRKEEDSGGGSPGGKKKESEEDLSTKASLEEYKRLTRAQPELKGAAGVKSLQQNIEKFHNKFDDPGPKLEGFSAVDPKAEKREAKAGQFDAKAKALDKQINDWTAQRDALDPGYKNALKRSSLKSQIEQATAERDHFLENASRVRDGKLTSGQKKALIAAGIGAVIVGGVVYTGYRHGQMIKGLEKAAMGGDIEARLKLYDHHVASAKMKTWFGGNYIQESSWDRPEFELPKGHIFHRISTTDESAYGFRLATYSTPDEIDFNRYIKGFRGEKGPFAEFYHTTFSTTAPTKIPDLHTAVETMRETLGPNATRAQAISEYQRISGGSWTDSLSKSYISNLKAKGFGGIIDEMDAGVIGERPIVFFNSEHATAKTAKILSKNEIINREKAVELMTKPPRKA